MSESLDDVMQKGDEAFERENYKEACDYFGQAVRIDPDNLGAWLSLSAAYFSDGKFEVALEVSERGLELFPEEAGFAVNAGLASNRLGEDYDAVHFYTKALEINPRYAKAYYARGNCYFFWNEYQKAEEDYRRALEFGGEFDDINFNLAYSLEALGRYREALVFYDTSLAQKEARNSGHRKGICHYILEGSGSPEAYDLLHEYYYTVYPGSREVGLYLAVILRDQERYEELEEHLKTPGMAG